MASLGVSSSAIPFDVADRTTKTRGLRGCASIYSSSDFKFGRSKIRDDGSDRDDGNDRDDCNDHHCVDQHTPQLTLLDDALVSLGWFRSISLSTHTLMPATW